MYLNYNPQIVNELAQFEHLCKSTRDNLRLAVIARDKEVLRQRQMLELKSKFSANNVSSRIILRPHINIPHFPHAECRRFGAF